VQLKIDWARSNPIDILVAPGATLKLRCRPRGAPLASVYYAFLSPSRYLELSEVADLCVNEAASHDEP
jgi:hypothetical protein